MPDINIFNVLLAIQKKHAAYFSISKITILDCVSITWVSPVRVTVIRNDIPAEIMEDITMLLMPINGENKTAIKDKL